MTSQQVSLLQRLIVADRNYWVRLEAARSDKSVSPPGPNDRGVEVGWINDVNPRTAKTLVELGLAEEVSVDQFRSYIFLGSYNLGELQ